ncbi:hypothetical protein GOV14_03825 [Candidatus Pacearchaeota archaeon]|nr:hypothetical protein [Candidatus Pacearchaeota archaeon]
MGKDESPNTDFGLEAYDKEAIFEKSIDEVKAYYDYLYNSGIKFFDNNQLINYENDWEYDRLYDKIFSFYTLSVNMAQKDLKKVSLTHLIDEASKKEFANEVSLTLKLMLTDLERVRHEHEVNPFYNH